MYKVLLVDDERTILEGIARIVDWEAAGTTLCGTARNGLEAWEFVTTGEPDIVISDIRMPGMDGIALAERVSREFPHIRIILLSGYGEFAYAQSAMQFGVKHYLLKPCNETKIAEALAEVVKELGQQREKEQFVANMREGMRKVLPHVKEQFLKEFVTNKTYGSRDWAYYRQLFGFDWADEPVRLLLFQLEGTFAYEHLFAVKNISEDLLRHTVLSSTVGDHVLVVLKDVVPSPQLHERIAAIRETFRSYYKIDVTAALSEPGDFIDARKLYNEALACLQYRFYLGEGTLITQRDVMPAESDAPHELQLEPDRLLLRVKAGLWDEASGEIDAFFQALTDLRLSVSVASSYVVQWFVAIIRLGSPEQTGRYMERLVALSKAGTLPAAQALFKETAQAITERHYEANRSKHSAIVGKVIEIVDKHLGDPELSLSGVAHQMLYMNADYLGKLFKKETGEKFSNYVMKARIAKAKEALEEQADMKIFELAERLGFGDNPQYFSQVFKKYVGCTPSEYGKTNG